MPKMLKMLLRAVGIGRPKPTTPLRRLARRVERAALAAAAAYGLLQAFPQALFAHSVEGGVVTLYSRRPLPAGAVGLLARSRALIARAELAVPGRRERVFLCDSAGLFRLFAPLSPGAFAVSVPWTGNIFVAAADLDSDVARSGAARHNARSFSALVAHEATHGLIRRRLGALRAARLPAWVSEGYCDYVAGEGSFPEAEGAALFARGGSDPSDSYRYYVYRRMVAHLIDGRHLDFAGIVALAGGAEAVEAEARARGR